MELAPNQLAELGLLLFGRRARLDLEDEVDEEVALRKALLIIAALSQDVRTPALNGFRSYILTSFGPLTDHLNAFDHGIWHRETLDVRADSSGAPIVAIQHNTLEKLFDDFEKVDASEQRDLLEILSGSRMREQEAVPWSATADRYVAYQVFT